jgi:hypothetical protein
MITPADTPSSPADYAGVTPHGQGPAPYDIQADQADVAGLCAAAERLTGAGVLYPQGPRQAQTEALLNSPQGYADFDITAGYSSGGGDNGWPNDVTPGG